MKTPKPPALFVDSEEEHTAELIALLTSKGYQARSFSSGTKLFNYLNGEGAKIRPALILLDVSTKGLGGFEAARRLAELPATSEVPLLMMARYCTPEDKIEALSAGAITCLQKPIDLTTIEKEIEAKKSRDAKNKSVLNQQF